ncbi:MAG: winged helix-turn-helix transcriptional regulator [Candidatus Acidiferrales bacterium]
MALHRRSPGFVVLRGRYARHPPQSISFPPRVPYSPPSSCSLSGKWKVQILWHLSFGPRRFAQIRKKLSNISEKVLTDQLRQLERDGVLQRRVNPLIPPQVTYSLSPEGLKLVPMMELLCAWGSSHFGIKPNLPRAASKIASL